MKIAIIGAAGVRTPLIVQAILTRIEQLKVDELALMDIDGDRLELISALISPLINNQAIRLHLVQTVDPHTALEGADYVITTFRVGGIESRAIDERVPLNHGVLGQETTGAGGFAMGVRSIPVLLDYVQLMHRLCPGAWLINFANPAGMLTEAVLRHGAWKRVVGICDGPAAMRGVIASLLGGKSHEIYLDYFGLNHLGWIKRIIYRNNDQLPGMIGMLKSLGQVPGLPFEAELITSLGMIPNEYLYYYYYPSQAVSNILHAGVSRGEQIAHLNQDLFNGLKENYIQRNFPAMQAAYQAYLYERQSTYMVTETGIKQDLTRYDGNIEHMEYDEGYAVVALNLIEALRGSRPQVQILNVPNRGAISGMGDQDVVEVPALVENDQVQPLLVGDIPEQCLGLMKQVKHFEHLTMEAAVEFSYQKAHLALAVHPLVGDFSVARRILDEYILQHRGYFPELN